MINGRLRVTRWRLRLVLATAVALAALSGGCALSGGDRGRVIFALFDLSGSTATPDIRRRYLQDFLRIAERLRPGDVLVADVINENPLSQSEFPIREELPRFVPWKSNKIVFERGLRETKERVATRAQQLLNEEKRSSAGTCIVDASRLAERVFATYNRRRPILVVFSDMIEECQGIDFRRRSLSARATEQILAELKKTGRLPDLAGVRVYVVGAGRDVTGGLPAGRQREIQQFWQRFFALGGAELNPHRWGAALLAFEDEE